MEVRKKYTGSLKFYLKLKHFFSILNRVIVLGGELSLKQVLEDFPIILVPLTMVSGTDREIGSLQMGHKQQWQPDRGLTSPHYKTPTAVSEPMRRR